MKVIVLLKSGPGTDEAERALQTAADLLSQGHTVNLFLLQEAARFCQPDGKCSNSMMLQDLLDTNLAVHVLTRDAELRGTEVRAAGSAIFDGSYESLIDLMESCEQVVGIF
jgi:sulfur relay (sulfurtransferase) complex TusBCD TusD component (DsrE family)